MQDRAGETTQHPADRERGEGQQRKRQPLPPHQPPRPQPQQRLGQQIPNPAVLEAVVPRVDPLHGVTRKCPVRPSIVPRAYDVDRVFPTLAVGHVAHQIHTGGQAIVLPAIAFRRHRVQVDVETPFEHGRQAPREDRTSRLVVRGEDEVPSRRGEIALHARQLDERPCGGPGRVGRLGIRRLAGFGGRRGRFRGRFPGFDGWQRPGLAARIRGGEQQEADEPRHRDMQESIAGVKKAIEPIQHAGTDTSRRGVPGGPQPSSARSARKTYRSRPDPSSTFTAVRVSKPAGSPGLRACSATTAWR